MSFGNTKSAYGTISIVLHWLGAASVLTMLGSAIPMYLHRGPDHAARVPFIAFHVSVGMLVLVLLVARVVWHFTQPQPAKIADSPRLNRLAGMVHVTLLSLIVVQLVTGPVDVWTGGFPLRVFNLGIVPALVEKSAWHEQIGDFHSWTGRLLGLLVLLHLAGVARHTWFDRDRTLARMLGRPV